MMKDPVCGMQVDEQMAVESAVYQRGRDQALLPLAYPVPAAGDHDRGLRAGLRDVHHHRGAGGVGRLYAGYHGAYAPGAAIRGIG